jgi:hypothetical protein
MPELGSRPIEDEFHHLMNTLAQGLDYMFNKDGEREIGFILMTFKFTDTTGRCNYISNAHREDVIALLTEQLAYFRGMPDDIPARKQ